MLHRQKEKLYLLVSVQEERRKKSIIHLFTFLLYLQLVLTYL